LLMPAGMILVAAAVFGSAWGAWRRQAVVWRGTAYPLDLLKKCPPL